MCRYDRGSAPFGKVNHMTTNDIKLIGVAIVGLGVGEQHALAYMDDPRCRLISVFDIDRKKADEVAKKLGVNSVANVFNEILNDQDIELVSIASYDDAHYEQVMAVLKAGKHVFVEKPLCRTVTELSAIKNAWYKHRGQIKLSSNLILRAVPVYKWLKEKIENGELGEIYAFDGDYLYGRLQKITEGWRKNVENYSVMEGGGIHLIDLMIWLTGQKPSTVLSVGNKICIKDGSFRYNDFVASTFKFSEGMVGRISANFGCVHRHQHVMRVFGTKATFIYDDVGARIHYSRDPNIPATLIELPTLPRNKGDLIPSFVSAILENKDISAHTQEMFDVVSICSAADDALLFGREIEVKYI